MAKILIVDDDEKMRWLYQDILSSEGFDVLTAGNGEDGLKLAIENKPDLILLDVMMPHKKGGDVSEDLLDNNRTKDIPVMYLTSIITEEEVKAQQGKVSGRFIISKSSNRAELVRRINEVLPSGGR
ncbi:MAG: response regulator [Candidatus Omnitrophica bacterium]|nr:response regulator [Candidatus Omnitrophota bacterium]MDD5027245.1 response regulator [Candidatus Omnitrophota bacterium]MDD5661887.1 response regulator [Candidatus Omnitrophota bacterium]